MRALLLPALGLLTAAASAQEARPVPLPGLPAEASRLTTPGVRDCSRGAALEVPMPDGRTPVPEMPLGGPAPVPMPNLCAETAPGARPRAAYRPFGARPPAYRFRDTPGLDGRYRRFRLEPPAPGLDVPPEYEDFLRGLEAPVAPPDGRE